MSQPQPPLDEQGEAHEALNSAVASYGPRILENPQVLRNVVTDLLPDLSREQNLLIAAAEAGVAADLSQHVRDQNLDSSTAVQLAAHALSGKKSIDADSSMWVTTEYARAMGYAVPAYVPQSVPPSTPPPVPGPGQGWVPNSVPPPSVPGPGQGWAPDSVPPPSGPSVPPSVPPSAAQPGQPYAAQPGQPYAPSLPGSPAPPYGGGGYGGGAAPGTWPGGPTIPGGPPKPPGDDNKRRNRALLATAAGVAGVLIIYVIAAAAAHLPPFSKAAAVTHHVAFTPHSAAPKPAPSPSPTPAPGVANLAQLLPGDLGGTASQCQPQKPPYPFKLPGLVQALNCADPNLPGGALYAFQMDSSADFLTGWQNFDTWWGFDRANAGNTCPASSGGQGTFGWSSTNFPQTDNQVVECGWVGASSDTPAYAWALPTEDTFLYVLGAPGSAISALDNWWRNDSDPSASPSPASS